MKIPVGDLKSQFPSTCMDVDCHVPKQLSAQHRTPFFLYAVSLASCVYMHMLVCVCVCACMCTCMLTHVRACVVLNPPLNFNFLKQF